jgi:uncharacterized cupin superfamily protein
MKLDLSSVPVKTGTIYPPPYNAEVAGRTSLRLGDAGGLTQFGVNIVILAPGAKSSMRHWHLHEDEFVMVIQGSCSRMQVRRSCRLAIAQPSPQAWPTVIAL